MSVGIEPDNGLPIDVAQPRIGALRTWLLNTIPHDRQTPEVADELQSVSLNKLIGIYMNWIDRFIPPRPRAVTAWDGFWIRNDPRRLHKLIDPILAKCREGADLTPYLSRRIHTQGFAAQRDKRQGIAWADGRDGDKDMALNSYGIHHLHLIGANAVGRRSGGSDNLLYVGVGRDSLHLLMLGDHKSPNDGTLHEAVAEFRSDGGYDLRGVKAPRRSVDTREQLRMMRNGVSTYATVGDKLVVPGFMAVAGTSIFHTRHADRISIILQEWDPKLYHLDERRELQQKYETDLGDGPFEWIFWYGDFYLLNHGTERSYLLVRWRT